MGARNRSAPHIVAAVDGGGRVHGVLICGGFWISRWVSGPTQAVAVPNQNCAPAAEPYLLLCVKGNGRATGYCCKRHAFYGEDALPESFVPARSECTQHAHPDLPSFYNFQQNC